jgi:transcriptional regulator with XRE-family HTH domain
MKDNSKQHEILIRRGIDVVERRDPEELIRRGVGVIRGLQKELDRMGLPHAYPPPLWIEAALYREREGLSVGDTRELMRGDGFRSNHKISRHLHGRPSKAKKAPGFMLGEYRVRDETISGLARRSGVPRETLSRIVSGRTKPHRSTVLKLAQALGVRSSDLFPDVVHPPPETREEKCAENRLVRRLLRECEPLVRKFAKKRSYYTGPVVDSWDLAQEARIAILLAVRGHDPKRGRLEPRILSLIQNRILDASRREGNISTVTESFDAPRWDPYHDRDTEDFTGKGGRELAESILEYFGDDSADTATVGGGADMATVGGEEIPLLPEALRVHTGVRANVGVQRCDVSDI